MLAGRLSCDWGRPGARGANAMLGNNPTTLIGIGAAVLIIVGIVAYLYSGGSAPTTATAPSTPTQQQSPTGGTSGTGGTAN